MGCAALLFLVLLPSAASGAETPPADFGEIEQYARIEIPVALTKEYGNPYDPDEAALEAVVTLPSGRSVRTAGFYYELHDGVLGAPADTRGWAVRFTPWEVGPHRARVILQERDEAPRALLTAVFNVKSSHRPGFILAGPPPSAYLQTSRGHTFIPVGQNFGWKGDREVPADYLKQLDRLAAAGANCIRMWTCPWWLPIEGSDHGKRRDTIGRYDQQAAALLDSILDRCERLGIRVILCLEQHGNLQPKGDEVGLWPVNPYNAELGGPCATINEFFTKPSARDYFRKRLRYLLARFGHSTALMAWELFNEVEYARFEKGSLRNNLDMVLDWHTEMARFLKRNDPYGRPIATSGDEQLQEQLLLRGLLDFFQYHLYHKDDYALAIADLLRLKRNEYGVPILVGEYGEWQEDARGVSFHHGLWASLTGGACGTGLYWWQGFQDEGAAWRSYGAVRRFAAAVDWAAEDFEPARLEQVIAKANDPGARDEVELIPSLEYGDEIRGGVVTRIIPDGHVLNGDKLPKFLHARAKDSQRQPLIFDVDFDGPGAIALLVGRVSDSATLDFYVDGRRTTGRLFRTGPDNTEAEKSVWREEWKVFEDVYNKEYTFQLPGGHHVVKVQNTGRDWIEILKVRFPAYTRPHVPAVGLVGVRGRRSVLVYGYDPTFTWRAANGRLPESPPAAVTITVHDVANGVYDVSVWDTRAGEVTARKVVKAEKATLQVPDVAYRTDFALRAVRRVEPLRAAP